MNDKPVIQITEKNAKKALNSNNQEDYFSEGISPINLMSPDFYAARNENEEIEPPTALDRPNNATDSLDIEITIKDEDKISYKKSLSIKLETEPIELSVLFKYS